MTKLGRRIARLRQLARMSQAELAEEVEVTPETISRIENGSLTARLQLLDKLADAVGVKLYELFRWDEEDRARDTAIDRLLDWATRLSAEEVQLVMDIGSVAVMHVRQRRAGSGPALQRR